MQTFKLFVSSPGDVTVERRRVENVVSRLNGEFAGVARLEALRWETEFYQAYSTFQAQIPRSTDCDLVIGILRWRLGTELPPDFAEKLPNDRPFPSGTAYEILTAIEQRQKGGELPDVYVFRFAGGSPPVPLDDPNRASIERNWLTLKNFFEEWFLTARGHFKAAFNPYNSEDDFEAQLEKLLRKWVADKVAGGHAVRWPIAVKGSPFCGLSAFGAKHAPVFFGRGDDISRAVDLWREAGGRGAPYLLIVGASGSGKSSLARAGLLPRLTTPGVIKDVDAWRVAVMRPGDSPAGPFAALAAALMQDESALPKEEEGRGAALPEIGQGDSQTPAELAAALRNANAAAAIKPISNALFRVGTGEHDRERYSRDVRCDLVLLIDQFEELFAASVSDAERNAFIDLVAALVSTRRVWVAATLRADFYARMLVQPTLKRLKELGATYDLAPPGPADLADIVRGPAEAAGLLFETDAVTGERLDTRLLSDADRPDMLPLVQLALSRLFEGREIVGSQTVLPLKIYESLGGLKGIVNEAGEKALAAVGEAEKDRLPRLLRQLAVPAHDPDGISKGALTIRAVPLSQVAPDGDEATRKLVAALTSARLLTTTGSAADAQVRLTHQRVLEDWSRGRTIVAESTDFYRIRAELEESRRKWEAGKRRRELLLPRGLPLAEAASIVGRYSNELMPEALAYVQASRQRAQRLQMIGWGLAAFFFVLALAAIGAGVVAYYAEEQTIAAQRRFGAAQQQANILNVLAGFIPEETEAAIKQSLEAIRAGGNLDTDEVALQQADAMEEMARYSYEAWDDPDLHRFLKVTDDLLGRVSSTGTARYEFTRLEAGSHEIAGDKNGDDDRTIPQAQSEYGEAMQLYEKIRNSTAGALGYARTQRKLAALDIRSRDYSSAEAHLAAASQIPNDSNSALSERAELDDVRAAKDVSRGDNSAAQLHLEEAVAIERKALTDAIVAKQPIFRLRAALASHLQHLGDVLRHENNTKAGPVYDEAETLTSEILETYPTQLGTRFTLDLIRHGRSLLAGSHALGTETINRNTSRDSIIDGTFGDGFGPFKFGMTSSQINAALDHPFGTVEPALLPRAREYRTGDVRYFWVSIASLAAFRSFYEPIVPCLNPNFDYVVFMFHENSLMRISYRLLGSYYQPRETGCSDPQLLFPDLAQRFQMPLLGTPKAWRLHWETSRSTVIGSTHYDGPMLDIIQR